MLIPSPSKNPRKSAKSALSAFLCILLLALLPPRPAHAQGSGNWRTYTTADGLLSNNIQALAYREDPLDFPPCDRTSKPPIGGRGSDCPAIPGLWIGTDKGLTYVNGREAVSIDEQTGLLPTPDVRALLFDNTGLLWVGTTGGLVRLNYGAKPWEARIPDWHIDRYLTGREVLTLARTTDGHIWAGTDAGLAQIDPQKQTEAILPETRSMRITTMPHCPFVLGNDCLIDKLWIGADQGLYILKSNQLENVTLPGKLNAGHITALTQADDGLWVGTDKGAAHRSNNNWDQVFDTLYRLPYPHIYAIDIDTQGRVWFGTARGTAVLRRGPQTWQHFATADKSMSSDQIQILLIDPQGTAWLGTDRGLKGLDNTWTLLDRWTTYDYRSLLSNYVQAVAVDAHGRAWVSTGDSLDNSDGVTVIDPDLTIRTTFTRYSGLPDNHVHVVAFDIQGRTWIGTGDSFDNGGVAVIDPDLTVHTILTEETGLAGNDVRVVTFDAQGRAWVGTRDSSGYGEVTVIDPDLTVRTTFTRDNGLAAINMLALAVDAQGRAWVGTESGVTVIDPDLTVHTTFTQENGLTNNKVRAVVFDTQGRAWVGMGDNYGDGGLTVIDSDLTVRTTLHDTFTRDSSMEANFVRSLAVDTRGRIWASMNDGNGYGGVTVIDPNLTIHTTFTSNNGLLADSVRVVAVDAQGRVWVSTEDGGVTVVNPDLTIRTTFTRNNGLVENDVRAVAFDAQGRAWVGTSGGGVTVINPDLTVRTTFMRDNGLADVALTIAIDTQGRAWVGTFGGGVTVIDSDLTVLTTFTSLNGLTGNTVPAMAFDAQGRAWIVALDTFADGGVTVIDSDLTVLTTFTSLNGLVEDSVRAVAMDTQGRVWVGTESGMTVIDPDLTVRTIFTNTNRLVAGDVRAVAVDAQGRAWVGTTEGVTVINPDLTIRTTFTHLSGLAGDVVRAVAFDAQGRAWVGTTDGVTVIDPDLTIRTKDNMLAGGDAVQAVAFDAQRRAWVGTAGGMFGRGLTVIEPDLTVRTTFAEEDGLAGNNVLAVALDPQGRIWVGIWGRGVAVFTRRRTTLWLRLETPFTTNEDSLQLLDTRAFDITFAGGSLVTEPLELGYRLLLFNPVRPSATLTQTFAPGQITTASEGKASWGRRQELDYVSYRLTAEIVGLGLDSYQLPPFDFDIQAKPILISLQMSESNSFNRSADPSLSTNTTSPLATSPTAPLSALSPLTATSISTDNLTFSADTTFFVQWSVADPDWEEGDIITFTYQWDLPGEAPYSIQVTSTQDLSYTTLIRTPPPGPNAADQYLALELSVTDKDGNSSPVQIVRMTILAPPSYWQRLAPWLTGLVSTVGIAFLGLVALARTSGLPFTLLARQGPQAWLEVGLSYARYRQRWAALTPLEQLLLLLLAPKTTADQPTLQARLDTLQTLVPTTRLEEALTSLTRQQLLQIQGAGYRVTEPALLTALQAHEGATSRQRLAARVRSEHPLIATANHFFPAAGFTITPLADPLAFLCQPTSPVWEPWFQAPVYVRLIPDHPLDQEAIAELNRAAQGVPDRANVLFALIDRTPTDSGWIAIGALRADGIQVIPIDDAFMQQARSQQRERQELQAHLRRFLGRQRDLYNVRDPVADRLNFFGREATTQALLEILTAGHPLALFGLRKMGKSSLLQVLGDRLSFPVAHVDLQAGVDLAGLYTRILAGWQRTLPLKMPSVTWTPPRLTDDLTTAFTTAVNDLLAHLVTQQVTPRLAIFVDEIDLIMPTTPPPGVANTPSPNLGAGWDTPSPNLGAGALWARGGGVTLSPNLGEGWGGGMIRYLTFARTLRGLVQETGQLSLLVAGVDARFNHLNRWDEQQNPFYQFFREEYLGPLSQSDCIQMVRNIGRQMGLVYGRGAAEQVATLSGGHPFLARQLCSLALRLRGENAPSEITLADIEAAADQFVRDPSAAANLDQGGMWGEVTNPALWPPPQVVENAAILTTLAHTAPQPEPALLAAAVDRQARERSLTELEQRAVLGRLAQLLHIQFGLFRTWIQRYKLANTTKGTTTDGENN